MKKKKLLPVVCGTIFSLIALQGTAQNATWKESFDKPLNLTIVGRGNAIVKNGALQTKDASVTFGEKDWKNYSFSFKARSIDTADNVQIWAGFRNYNRDDRYVVAIRGGRQNNLYLSRRGYMGTDEFLALRSLDFHPVANTWYKLRVEVSGNRIRVYVNNDELPRIDIMDKNMSLASTGKVSLGGGWLHTEYDDIVVKPLSDNAFGDEPRAEYKTASIDKEGLRMKERSNYTSVKVTSIDPQRTTISLDGNWLFKPTYELDKESDAVSPDKGDKDWHVMRVPNFWNPIRIWLHGETFQGTTKGASDAYFQQETARCEGYSFDYKKTGAAWYRQWIELPAGVDKKNMELNFDAVSKVAEVYVNGKKVTKHIGMFGNFKANATGLLRPGKNLVVVKVVRDYVTDIKDADKVVDVAVSVPVTNKMLKDLAHGFYNDDPAGIWQPVSLTISDPLKINDVYIKPSLTGADFDVTIKNSSNTEKVFSVGTTIKDKNGNLYKGDALPQTKLQAGEEKVLHYSVANLKPLLWSPQTPNLYDFTFSINSNNQVVDSTTIVSGFRTFEVKDGLFYLNGRRYWLRGGNHTPFALAPNDKELANKFYDLMKQGNIEVTRTHTTPYNETWVNAADEKGIGISFEGTWPWLMINASMPDQKLIDLWADEFIDLLKKYRNHPSILFWTVNNEMKFYDNEPDFEKAKLKMRIISDVVKRMRQTDGSRPISFDSNYKRNTNKFGKDFFNTIDDGDIDDVHAYINWYDNSVFSQFNGEFQKRNKNEGRPLISQEMSSGYPNNETGHPTRFYTQVHQTPQTLVGDLAYEYSDPAYFLNSQSFITGEQAEAYRRTWDQGSGVLHFALLTWFKNVYDKKTIAPFPTYYALKRALQPVLVSAELWGRHFYAGEKLPTRICVVNDRHEGTSLEASLLTWQLVDEKGTVMTSGKQDIPSVAYYSRQWVTPEINIPQNLPSDYVNGKLQLSLTVNGKNISNNEYSVILGNKKYVATSTSAVVLTTSSADTKAAFDAIQSKYTVASTITEALSKKAKVYVFDGLKLGPNCTADELQQLKAFVSKGGRVLLLNAAGIAKDLYPEHVSNILAFKEGDIVNMDIPESPVFDGLGLLDLRYFNNNKRELPEVCSTALSINRNDKVDILAKHINVHGYIDGDMNARKNKMQQIQGATIVRVNDNGTAILSTMELEKATTDPVAGKLLSNMIKDLGK